MIAIKYPNTLKGILAVVTSFDFHSLIIFFPLSRKHTVANNSFAKNNCSTSWCTVASSKRNLSKATCHPNVLDGCFSLGCSRYFWLNLYVKSICFNMNANMLFLFLHTIIHGVFIQSHRIGKVLSPFNISFDASFFSVTLKHAVNVWNNSETQRKKILIISKNGAISEWKRKIKKKKTSNFSEKFRFIL